MRVLFIAYHFPPIGGAGSQRSQKFVKYLGEFGVEPIVIAGPEPANSVRWEPTDGSLAAEIPESTSIYRPPGPPPEANPLDGLRRRLMLPKSRERWWQRQIIDLGRAAIRDHDVDAILVTLSPYEGLAPSVILGDESGLPVVADLRDPWALDEVRLYPSALHRLADRRRMGRLLGRCAMVVANTDDAGSAMSQAFGSIADRVRVVTNGFDPDDFEEAAMPPGDGTFRIVHTGYLHSDLGLAQQRQRTIKRLLSGGVAEVNLLARSHYYLLEALEQLQDTDPALAARTRLVLAGVLSETDTRLIEASSVRDHIELVGYVAHRDAIELMRSADVLFLPMHDLPPGVRSRIVPGKTYEYLASNRPLLAAVPEGDARDLVAAFGATVVAPTDVEAMRSSIVEVSARSGESSGPRDGMERFERRHLSQRLASYLHDLGPEA